MNTGEKIKLIRTAKDLSQKELGDMIGTSQQMIAQYEKGARKPKIQTLQKIADALNVRLFTLLDNDTYEIKVGAYTSYNPFTGDPELEETEYIDLTDRAKLLDYYDSLNDLGKQEAIKRVSELAEIKRYIEPDASPTESSNDSNEGISFFDSSVPDNPDDTNQ